MVVELANTRQPGQFNVCREARLMACLLLLLNRFAQAKKPAANGMYANGHSKNDGAAANGHCANGYAANGHSNGAVGNGHCVLGNGAAAAQQSPSSYVEAAEVDAELNPDAVMQCSGSNALQVRESGF